jgi:hypothetical protein
MRVTTLCTMDYGTASSHMGIRRVWWRGAVLPRRATRPRYTDPTHKPPTPPRGTRRIAHREATAEFAMQSMTTVPAAPLAVAPRSCSEPPDRARRMCGILGPALTSSTTQEASARDRPVLDPRESPIAPPPITTHVHRSSQMFAVLLNSLDPAAAALVWVCGHILTYIGRPMPFVR